MDHEVGAVINYVEGKICLKDFQCFLAKNRRLQHILSSYAQKGNNLIYGKDIVPYIMGLHDRIPDKESLQEVLEGFLSFSHYPFVEFPEYKEKYGYLLKIQPSWLDIIDDQGIFDKLLEEVPKGLSKTKRIQWGKARIKELFRYDKTYPRWVQGAEWPIVNGKPLVFKCQKHAGKDDERVYYTFYDPDTKEEVVVTQLY